MTEELSKHVSKNVAYFFLIKINYFDRSKNRRIRVQSTPAKKKKQIKTIIYAFYCVPQLSHLSSINFFLFDVGNTLEMHWTTDLFRIWNNFYIRAAEPAFDSALKVWMN